MTQTNVLPSARCSKARGPQFTSLLSLFALWKSRRELANLDAAQLEDIGISRREAHAEAHAAPWNVPAHWRD